MLRFLRIGRLAVIDAVDIEFEPGFNVLTGETGAGKSILVEAVGLLLGGRASGDLVRTGAEVATVEALFQNGDEEIAIRREVTALGRSRSFLNGSLATAGALRDLMSGLIELHGQHEHQTLLDPSTHLAALDAFGDLEADAVRVRQAFAAWRSTIAEGHALAADARDRTGRLDLATFQLQDIERAAIGPPGEEEELLTTRRILGNAARVQQLCADSYAALYERDDAVLASLAAVWRRVAELAAIDPVFEPFVAARDDIRSQLEDLASTLRRYSESLDVSPARLQQVEERLAALDRVKKKYGPTLADVIARRDALAATVAALQSTEELLAAHALDVARRRTAFLDLALALSARRREAADAFSARLVDLVGGLALERARFEVRFNAAPLDEVDWHERGIDRAEFFLSPNPGEEVRPLARIVSGGELSRIMLALKTMIFGARLGRSASPGSADRQPGIGAPVMIFDEVDAGLGGRVAEVVGRRLRDLGSVFQVLCITHLPQVAAHADTHFVIEKRVRAGRTETRVRRLGTAERVEELGRMLAGSVLSEAVMASARELLARGTGSRHWAKGEYKAKSASGTPAARKPRAT
jgi:DNA repair protein RecN (Recombination protein N)